MVGVLQSTSLVPHCDDKLQVPFCSRRPTSDGPFKKEYQPLSECYKTIELDMFEDRACIIVIEQVLRSRVDNIFGYWNIQLYFSDALAGTRSESH